MKNHGLPEAILSGQLENIDPKNIVMGRELGQGEFGSVLMGVWTNNSGKKVRFLATVHLQCDSACWNRNEQKSPCETGFKYRNGTSSLFNAYRERHIFGENSVVRG